MHLLKLKALLNGVYSCLPSRSVDNVAACKEICSDATKAENVVKATGINRRRVTDFRHVN